MIIRYQYFWFAAAAGDVTASQVETLRQEVTAVVGWARPDRGDEVVLVLNSGGGTVVQLQIIMIMIISHKL